MQAAYLAAGHYAGDRRSGADLSWANAVVVGCPDAAIDSAGRACAGQGVALSPGCAHVAAGGGGQGNHLRTRYGARGSYDCEAGAGQSASGQGVPPRNHAYGDAVTPSRWVSKGAVATPLQGASQPGSGAERRTTGGPSCQRTAVPCSSGRFSYAGAMPPSCEGPATRECSAAAAQHSGSSAFLTRAAPPHPRLSGRPRRSGRPCTRSPLPSSARPGCHLPGQTARGRAQA